MSNRQQKQSLTLRLDLSCKRPFPPLEGLNTTHSKTLQIQLVSSFAANFPLQTYQNTLSAELLFLYKHLPIGTLQELMDIFSTYLLTDAQGIMQAERLQFSSLEVNFADHSWKIAADEIEIQKETNEFGSVDIIYEQDAYGIYRLLIAPNKQIPPHFHKQMDEIELILGNDLLLQNKKVKAGLCVHWPKNFLHTYQNTSNKTQLVLCIDKPKFIPQDEIKDYNGLIKDLDQIYSEFIW